MAQALVQQDEDLRRSVLRELSRLAGEEPLEIGVAADHGIVTLTGSVDSYARKADAQEAAHRALGVRDVANALEVHSLIDPARTDTEIAQAARRALEWDIRLPHQKIRTTVTDGWITLEGSVTLRVDRQRAERDVCDLWGVRGVTNSIMVEAP